MRCIEAVVIVMILLIPSVVFYSPNTEISRDEELDIVEGSRSGPQTFQDEMGGWWMQDEEEDFEGGEFEDTEVIDESVMLNEYSAPDEWNWEQIFTNDHPNQRSDMAMAYDPIEKKIVLFGGDMWSNNDETWIFDTISQTWAKVVTSGPSKRYGHSMLYDRLNRKILLFGGAQEAGASSSELWKFDTLTNTWTKISENGPSGRSEHAWAYDMDNNKIVLFGGKNTQGVNGLSDTWILNLMDYSWNQIAMPGPNPRRYHEMVYDRFKSKVVLFGGAGGGAYGDTWTFDTNNNIWIQVSNIGPFPREGHKMVFDDKNQLTLMFGGSGQAWDNLIHHFNCANNKWSQISVIGPSKRKNHAMVYDSTNCNIILFSGDLEGSGVIETWVLNTSCKFSETGIFTSPIIPLPSDQIWNNLTINATEQNSTKIIVSIINADTGLYIPEYRDMEPRQIDLSGLTATSIKLRCHLESDGENTPTLDSWKITWKKKIPKPEYIGGIPSSIPITEDTPEPAILDLSEYFGETRSNDFTYQIESITDNENINVEINDTYLDVTYLKENWTGKTDLIVNCTNAYGESTSSDEFSIVVQRVNDAPVWSSDPPPITIDEDGAYTSDLSYTDYITDAENDMLGLSAVCDVTNVTIQMSPEGYLTVIPEKDYFGTSLITITASEIYNPALTAVTTLALTINGVNDDPTIKLLSPGDGAVYNETEIGLSWEAEDIDTLIENITFNLYFGESKSPVLHTSDMTESSFELDGLSDKTTYYWHIMANDGEGGEATSPTRSFNIDTESEVIPGDTETDSGDLNVTIEVDVTKVVVEQGHETSFDVEITNDGEKPVTLTVVTSGDTAPCLSLNNFITLSSLEKKTETVIVTRTALMEPGNYTIALVFVSPVGMKYVSVPLWIRENRSADDEPKDGDDDEKNRDSGQTKVIESGDENSWLFLVVVFLFLVIILLAVLSMIKNSKLRSRMSELEKTVEKEEVLEGDAYVPRKTSFQHEIEDRTQIPVSPGPYQPPELPGQPFEPRVASFQSQQSPAPQLPTPQPAPAVDLPSAPAQPLPDLDLSGVPGITPPTPLAQGTPDQQIHESLQTPIGPFVQLPQTGGTPKEQEQKLLPKDATPASPPPTS